MSKTLLNQALLIRDETRNSANTAYRIGSLFINIIQKLAADGIVDEEVLDEETIANLKLSELVLDKLTVNEFIKCFGSLEFGKNGYVEGSKGGTIDEDGNAEFQSVRIRSSLKVLEVIMNRLTAMEGDFNFTESGTIDKVTHLEDNVYLLDIRKRWDFDFTAFKEHDVVYGSLNSLLADGSNLTSWFRVLSVDVSANTLTVAMYPDIEIPEDRNYPPVEGMNICRRGNAENKERQNCWYFSSYEGCIMYLEGVTKPILEESNYYLSLGRPKHLELFNGLPINYKHPYLFARGAIIQDILRVDWKGNPIYEISDVGPWQSDAEYIRGYNEAEKKYTQHQVWHKSCCWRCAVEKATVGLAPRWNNLQWVCVVGDSNFSLSITSSHGRFFYFGREYTTLGFILKHGDLDISVDAWQVEWSRESGLPEEDALWNIEHSSCGNTVDITPNDMPSNWYETRKVVFRCTVYLKDGETEQTITETISIN